MRSQCSVKHPGHHAGAHGTRVNHEVYATRNQEGHALRTCDSWSGGAYVVDHWDNAWGSRAPGPHTHGNTARQVVDGLRTEVCGQQKQSNNPRNNQHNPSTPKTGLHKHGNDTSRSTGQRPTESSDLTQHAKGRTGDCPGPRKETTTRRNATQGVQVAIYLHTPGEHCKYGSSRHSAHLVCTLGLCQRPMHLDQRVLLAFEGLQWCRVCPLVCSWDISWSRLLFSSFCTFCFMMKKRPLRGGGGMCIFFLIFLMHCELTCTHRYAKILGQVEKTFWFYRPRFCCSVWAPKTFLRVISLTFWHFGNAMHAVRTQCKVLDVGKYSNPVLAPFHKFLVPYQGFCGFPSI